MIKCEVPVDKKSDLIIHLYWFISDDDVNYVDYSSNGMYPEVGEYPKKIYDKFPGQPYPVDAADRYSSSGSGTATAYLLKDDMIREYDVSASSTDPTVSFLREYHIHSTDNNPFNNAAGDALMPSGVTALHTSARTGYIFAFVGEDVYVKPWATGDWQYKGKFTCTVL